MSRQEFEHNNVSYNHNNVVVTISRHIENSCIVKTVYSGIFRHSTISGTFNNIQPCSGILMHIRIYRGIFWHYCSVGNYMFKVSNRGTRARCEICSKVTIKTLERRHEHHKRYFGVFFVNFEYISQLALVFLLLTLSR